MTSTVAFSDAVAFVNEVKNRFQVQESERFRRFLDVLRDYDDNRHRMSMEDLFERMKGVLVGHDDLILEFDKFLPPKGVTLPLEHEQPPHKYVRLQDAINFENKIKARDSELYKSFLDILGIFKGKNRTFAELHSEVSVILQGHPDLLDEFRKFIPNAR